MRHSKRFRKIGLFLQDALDESGADGFVLGLSGGLDSAVAAKVASMAAGPENVVCWTMPAGPTSEENVEDARELADELGVELREVDISPVVDRFRAGTPFELGKVAAGNVQARVRMVYEYIEANENNMMVLGADNKSEIQLGYFTKHGDGAVDVAPFGDLYKTELKEFAEWLELDPKFIEKQPTAELWEGQTDESELGDPYEVIDPILKCLIEEELGVEKTAEKTGYNVEKVRKYAKMRRDSEHKRRRPPSPRLR